MPLVFSMYILFVSTDLLLFICCSRLFYSPWCIEEEVASAWVWGDSRLVLNGDVRFSLPTLYYITRDHSVARSNTVERVENSANLHLFMTQSVEHGALERLPNAASCRTLSLSSDIIM